MSSYTPGKFLRAQSFSDIQETFVAVDRHSRRSPWFIGFLILGMLLSLPGAFLVVWNYYVIEDGGRIGFHFFAVNAGYLAGVGLSERTLRAWPTPALALWASMLIAAGFAILGLALPPVDMWWRVAGLTVLGIAAGTLGTALFHALEKPFEARALESTQLAISLFGAGGFLIAILGALLTVAARLSLATAAIGCTCAGAVIAIVCTGRKSRVKDAAGPRKTGVRKLALGLFSALFFFQLGTEWAIAGWLPLFLIHRLGSNPSLALQALAFYFLCLAAGRRVARGLLRLMRQRQVLLFDLALALCGYLLLGRTNSLTGAFTAVLLLGLGFGSVYPVVAANLDERFSYRPGLYNGMVTIAVSGGLAFPWLLGIVGANLGMQYVLFVPAAGSVAVCILAFLILLESRVMRGAASRGDLLY